MSAPNVTRAIEIGRQAQVAAGKVRNSLLPNWRQRAFRRQLGRFIVALQEIPQTEAGVLTAKELSELNAIVERVVTEADAFIAARFDATTAEVEQDRFVVTEIYQLRAILETLARHVTADPDVMDVSWTVRTQDSNRPKR